MPLSTTGLRDGVFTRLRVLRNGVLQDVLPTITGSSDTANLQSQLDTKATSAALSAVVRSLGAEIDSAEVDVGAVGAAVGAVGTAF